MTKSHLFVADVRIHPFYLLQVVPLHWSRNLVSHATCWAAKNNSRCQYINTGVLFFFQHLREHTYSIYANILSDDTQLRLYSPVQLSQPIKCILSQPVKLSYTSGKYWWIRSSQCSRWVKVSGSHLCSGCRGFELAQVLVQYSYFPLSQGCNDKDCHHLKRAHFNYIFQMIQNLQQSN